MKIKKAKLVSMMVACGFKAAGKWSNERFMQKLPDLPASLEKGFKCEDATDQETLDRVLKALKSDEGVKSIEILGGDEAAPEKPAKPAKGDKKSTKEKKPAAKDKKAAAKPAASSKKTKAAKKAKKEGGPSNKEICYKAYKKSKDKTGAITQKLLDAVGGAVQETTVRNWISQWNNGKNLPACANDE